MRDSMRGLFGAVAFAAVLFGGAAAAQDWPAEKTIRFVNGFAPGGGSDLLARYIADKLTTLLGQQVIVEPRTGSNGMVAARNVADSEPDGYTLLHLTMGMASISPPLLGDKMPLDIDEELTPITSIAGLYNILVVDPKTPFKTVKDIIDAAKANPGSLTYASAGNGSSQHLSGELFKSMTGTDILHVPYRGGAPAITDMMGSRVHLMLGNLPDFMSHIQSGGLRPVAFGTVPGSPTLPDVPTIDQTIPDFRIDNWFGMAGPAGLPQPIVERLNAAVNEVLAMPESAEKLGALGFKLMGGSQAEFVQTIANDRAKWAKVIQDQGIKAD